jgi:hypothetical protein
MGRLFLCIHPGAVIYDRSSSLREDDSDLHPWFRVFAMLNPVDRLGAYTYTLRACLSLNVS